MHYPQVVENIGPASRPELQRRQEQVAWKQEDPPCRRHRSNHGHDDEEEEDDRCGGGCPLGDRRHPQEAHRAR